MLKVKKVELGSGIGVVVSCSVQAMPGQKCRGQAEAFCRLGQGIFERQTRRFGDWRDDGWMWRGLGGSSVVRASCAFQIQMAMMAMTWALRERVKSLWSIWSLLVKEGTLQ